MWCEVEYWSKSKFWGFKEGINSHFRLCLKSSGPHLGYHTKINIAGTKLIIRSESYQTYVWHECSSLQSIKVFRCLCVFFYLIYWTMGEGMEVHTISSLITCQLGWGLNISLFRQLFHHQKIMDPSYITASQRCVVTESSRLSCLS